MKNPQLEKLIEEMIDNHSTFIRGYAELVRRAYRLGRNDERMGIPEEVERNKKLSSGHERQN